MRRPLKFLPILGWMLILVGGGTLLLWPEWAPCPVLASLGLAVVPLRDAWRGARGTALRAAILWAILAIGLGALEQIAALREPFATGRPVAGHWSYLATLTAFAASISVLNARRPGGGAWAILMGLLVLVFLLPWVEGSGLARGGDGWDRLRLDSPWTLFYGVIVLAGGTNYLPTRYGPAAAWLIAAFLLELLGLTRTDWPLTWRARIWSASSWALAASAWTAWVLGTAREDLPPGPERLWVWFRDHWGVVWALRVQDRFNRSAEATGWPVRLAWPGFVPAPRSDEAVETSVAVEATLKGLLRRFADAERIERAAGREPSTQRLPNPGPLPGGEGDNLAASPPGREPG
jgi:hypothetical protein